MKREILKRMFYEFLQLMIGVCVGIVAVVTTAEHPLIGLSVLVGVAILGLCALWYIRTGNTIRLEDLNKLKRPISGKDIK
jgi:hypothetical protein